MRNQRGFSLVEVVAAVALLLVAASIAVLRFGTLQPRQQLSTAAYRLAGDLRLARQRAQLEGVHWELVLDGPSGRASGYHLYFEQPGGVWNPYMMHGTAAVALPGGVTITDVAPAAGAEAPGGGPVDGVNFMPPMGTLSGATTLLTLTDGLGDRFQVRVHATTGYVEVCKSSCP